MIINVTYDPSVTSTSGANPCPTAAFEACVNAVVQFYETQFTNPITINIDVGWGEVDGYRLGADALGESISNYTTTNYTYAQIVSALTAAAQTSDAQTAVASLPAADPTDGGVFAMTTAEAKALGLSGASSALDGYVGFTNVANTFDFAITSNSAAASVPAGEYDLFSVVAHEFSEVMGRQANFGVNYSGGPGQGSGYYPLDLFDYSASGVRSFNASAASRYFSINGGVTDLDNFNTDSSGDLFDWAASAGDDAYDAFLDSGVVNLVTGTDLREMNVLGYEPTTNFTWASQVSGPFTTAADWTAGVVPGASDAAILAAPGSTAYTVTASSSQTVASIQTASTATLAITGGVFTAANGTGSGANDGETTVAGGATLEFGGVFTSVGSLVDEGTIAGTGTLALTGGTAAFTGATLAVGYVSVTGATVTLSGTIGVSGVVIESGPLQVAAGGAALTGAGVLVVSNGEINAAASTSTLTNDIPLYSVGSQALVINTGANAFTNAGAIVAEGTGGVTIDSPLDNTGELIAYSSPLIVDGAVSGSGAVVPEEAGTQVDLSGTGNVFTGNLAGAGTVAFTAGSDTFDAGTNLTVADVTQSGAAVAVGTNLAYAGDWTQSAGTLTVASGDTAGFSGTNSFSGGLAGPGTIALTGGADALDGATLAVGYMSVTGATVTLSGTIGVSGVVIESGPLQVAAGGAALTGAGVLVVSNGEINAAASTSTLTNDIPLYSVGSQALVINTGANAFVNAGAIVAEGTGGVTIDSPLDNTGELIAYSSPLIVDGAVTGSGVGVIENNATLIFDSTFGENVIFTPGSTGALELGSSQTYGGTITGLSTSGANALDLLDIDFADSPTASYSGTTTSGVLTVKDSLGHTAKITLEGDYLGSSFTLSAGPGGGTQVVDPLASAAARSSLVASPHAFVAAMASFAAPSASAQIQGGALEGPPRPLLATPRFMQTA